MHRQCRECSESFEVRSEDLTFLHKVSPVIGGREFPIPPPTLCPICRWQRRMSYRNERRLYRRQSDRSGREMVSMHAADVAFPVYHISEWLMDDWEARDYGREFDFSRGFFEQFAELAEVVPRFNAFVDPALDENSEYTNCAGGSKNCYLISQAEYNQDCYYSRGINNCRDCCDCLRVNRCELCYECINASGCYHCLFLQDSVNSAQCWFSSGLRSCRFCFGCHCLEQKEYQIFNKPVSRRDYEIFISQLRLTWSSIDSFKRQSEELRRKVPQRHARIYQCENSSGDHLLNSKNAYLCFDSKDLEDCAYCFEVLNGAKDSYDFSMFGLNSELLYECNGCGFNAQNVLFSNHCWQNVSALIYCDSCFPSVKNCFGCIGLRRAEYCILNKQYSREEYERLLPRIIELLQRRGEWGEFFPVKTSVFTYNESLASEFFPLSKEQVAAKGWRWRDEVRTLQVPADPVTPPEEIGGTDDSITNEVLVCEMTGRPYRLVAPELSFYRKIGVAVPRKCPEARHQGRFAQRNPRTLFVRRCEQCGRAIQSSYRLEDPRIVYCEQCYLNR